MVKEWVEVIILKDQKDNQLEIERGREGERERGREGERERQIGPFAHLTLSGCVGAIGGHIRGYEGVNRGSAKGLHSVNWGPEVLYRAKQG